MAYFKTQPEYSFSHDEDNNNFNNTNDERQEPAEDLNYIKKPNKVTNTLKKKPLKLPIIRKQPIYTKKNNNDEIAKAKRNPNRKPVKLFDDFESKSANFNDNYSMIFIMLMFFVHSIIYFLNN